MALVYESGMMLDQLEQCSSSWAHASSSSNTGSGSRSRQHRGSGGLEAQCSAARRGHVSPTAVTREPSPEREPVRHAHDLDVEELALAFNRPGRPRWADLTSDNSDDEPEEAMPAPAHEVARSSATRWADLVDSEGEESPAGRVTPTCSQEEQAGGSSTSSSGAAKTEAPRAQHSRVAPPAAKNQTEEKRGEQTRWQEQTRAAAGAAAQQWSARSWKQGKPGAAAGSSSWQRSAQSSRHHGWEQKNSWGAQSWNSSWDNSWGAQSWNASQPQKMQCQFTIGIEEEPVFRVVRRLLGSGGEHVKRFAQATGAKLRLRGRGSKFLEGPQQVESSDPLMLCISAPDAAGYAEVVNMVTEHLERIYEEYARHCQKAGLPSAPLSVQLHEGARTGAR